MKCSFLLIVSCLVIYSEALECGFEKLNKDDVKKVLTACVRNNETLEKIWELVTSATSSSTESKEGSDSKSTEDKIPQSNNSRKARETGRVQGTTLQVNEKRSPDINLTNTTSIENSSERMDTTTMSSMESSDSCMTRCTYQQLGLANDKGFPDHGKIVEESLKEISDRELRVFVQESLDECFQQVGQDNNADPCAYSRQLTMCLANKARMNCSDWPLGGLPF